MGPCYTAPKTASFKQWKLGEKNRPKKGVSNIYLDDYGTEKLKQMFGGGGVYASFGVKQTEGTMFNVKDNNLGFRLSSHLWWKGLLNNTSLVYKTSYMKSTEKKTGGKQLVKSVMFTF